MRPTALEQQSARREGKQADFRLQDHEREGAGNVPHRLMRRTKATPVIIGAKTLRAGRVGGPAGVTTRPILVAPRRTPHPAPPRRARPLPQGER